MVKNFYLKLVILFFFIIGAIFLILPTALASHPHSGCIATPSQVNADGSSFVQSTLTTPDTGGFGPIWYAKLVQQLPDGTTYAFEVTTASQTSDNDPEHSTYVANFGPFNTGNEGNYTIYFDTAANVGTGNYQASCNFSVQSGEPPPSGIICPTFSSLEPPEDTITSESFITINYNTSGTSPIGDYNVEILDENNINVKTINLSESGSAWKANIGTLPGPAKVYSANLNFNGVSPSHVCHSTNISVLDSRDQGFGSGENPCSATECATALGTIPTNITEFAQRFLAIAIGLAGGIALILLVFGSIRVLTSSGDQQRLAGGRDTIIAAVAGLLFLIFSVLILRALGLVIGVPFS